MALFLKINAEDWKFHGALHSSVLFSFNVSVLGVWTRDSINVGSS